LKKIPVGSKVSLIANPKFPFCNSLLIEDEKVALVDSGIGVAWIKMILKEKNIDVLLNSHTHPDHITGNNFISKVTSAEIYVPEQEQGYTRSLEKMKKGLGVRGRAIEPAWDKIAKKILPNNKSCRELPLREGQIFDFGKIRLEAIYTPGHSPGHFCFFLQDEDLLFVSDLGLDSFGPWYGYLNSELGDYLSTIKKIKKMGIKRGLASHYGGVIDDLDKGLDRCLKIVDRRENRIVELLKNGPKDVDELAQCKIIYNNIDELQFPYDAFILFFEKNMIKQHLGLLMDSGKVKKEGRHYSLFSS